MSVARPQGATPRTSDELAARLRDARTLLVRRGVNGVPDADRLLGEILNDLERPTGRDDPHRKALRYLAEGRLEVVLLVDDEIEATCDGDGGTYLAGWHGSWHCSCPARTEGCAHLIALRLVTTAYRPSSEEHHR